MLTFHTYVKIKSYEFGLNKIINAPKNVENKMHPITSKLHTH